MGCTRFELGGGEGSGGGGGSEAVQGRARLHALQSGGRARAAAPRAEPHARRGGQHCATVGQRRGSHAAVAALQLLPLAVSKDVIGSGPKRGCAGWHRHAWLTISKPGSHLARQPCGRHSARSGCRAAVQAAHGDGLFCFPTAQRRCSPAGYKLANAGRRVQHSACAAAAPPQLVR